MHFLDSRTRYICLDKAKHQEFLSIKKLLRRWVRNRQKLRPAEWQYLIEYLTDAKDLRSPKRNSIGKPETLKDESWQFYSTQSNYNSTSCIRLLDDLLKYALGRKTIKNWDIDLVGNQLLFRHSSIYHLPYWFLNPLPGCSFSDKFITYLEKNTSPFFKLYNNTFDTTFDDFFISEDSFDCTIYFVISEEFSEDILFELDEATFENEEELMLFRELHQQNAEGKVHLILCVPD